LGSANLFTTSLTSLRRIGITHAAACRRSAICNRTPLGRLTAIDVNTGDFAWQVPFGSVAGAPEDLKTGGQSSGGGPISTAGGLVFIGGATDKFFRAIDAKTGQELWRTKLEEIALSVPISWLGADGKQYVAVAAGSKLLTFRLPK
jgi:glucose dehydrogenase